MCTGWVVVLCGDVEKGGGDWLVGGRACSAAAELQSAGFQLEVLGNEWPIGRRLPIVRCAGARGPCLIIIGGNVNGGVG